MRARPHPLRRASLSAVTPLAEDAVSTAGARPPSDVYSGQVEHLFGPCAARETIGMAEIAAGSQRRIMHCDLDCFFVAVEELDDPSLVGRPVIVGGDPDRRGVVSTANYAARRYGVRSAMAAALARRLCPHAVFMHPRFERYRELSRAVMDILDEYFTVRERASIDEAYGVLPEAPERRQPALLMAREIRRRVREETGLTISIGAGESKSVAKLASDLSKPDGCVVVPPSRTSEFLRPLPVGVLPGVGPRTRFVLERAGYTTVGQLALAPSQDLQRLLGLHGVWLWRLANGEDDRPVVAERGQPKSISRERTYERDIADLARLESEVRALATSVARQAADQDLPGRTVTVKVRWSDFHIATRQIQMRRPAHDASVIAEAALGILRREFAIDGEPERAVRLIGVGLSGFQTETRGGRTADWVQLPLFQNLAS